MLQLTEQIISMHFDQSSIRVICVCIFLVFHDFPIQDISFVYDDVLDGNMIGY